ncbi:MAG: M48 family metallopeptidase [Bacteroidota bacterium]
MVNGLYFDGQTAKSYECTLFVTDEYLYINFAEPEKNIIWARSRIKHFELNGNYLIIKYGDFPQQTIECHDKASVEIFEKLSENNFAKKSKSIWLKNTTTIAITLCVAFVVVCFASYFIVLPWVGEKSVALIPPSAEIELGNSINESILQTSTKEDSATYFANLFVSKLKTGCAYSIHITVIKSDEINAFALPGGKIFVYSKIIKKIKTYEEFTALIGHEISHVSDQHSLKTICRSMASSLFIACLFGDVTGIMSGIAQQANEFKQLSYSRDLETKADNDGFEMMLQNKISPEGMIDLLKLLQTESKEMPDFMKYISSHPETEARIKNIQSRKEMTIAFNENPELKLIFERMKSSLN